MNQRPPKRPPGHPAFVPTDPQRQLVRILISHGFSHEAIARNLQINSKTLKKAFKPELEYGHEQLEAAMGVALVRAGLNGNVNAIRYWLYCHGDPRWKATNKDMDEVMPLGGAGTTIIIKGGLAEMRAANPDQIAPAKPNGHDEHAE